MNSSVYQYLLEKIKDRGAVYAVLIDPDRKNDANIEKYVEAVNTSDVDLILVGGSLMMDSRCHDRTRRIKENSAVPVVFFPGGLSQLSPHFDAMLFMSILSGRNPHYLIGEQVMAAPIVHDMGIETIPTGYLLVNGGIPTTVQFMSNTTAIPANRPNITVAHALAAQYLGMKLVYLEAGSGASQAVPTEMVQAVASVLDIPILVGGGLRSPEDCADRIEAGAGFIVMGTRLESDPGLGLLRELTAASHPREMIEV